VGPDVVDLLPLGLCGATVIILGLDRGTCLMRRSHVRQLIRAAEFKRSDVLGNPVLAHSINLPVTDHADTGGSLPYLEPSMGRELSARCHAHIHNLDE
jgi:hypothetical protein